VLTQLRAQRGSRSAFFKTCEPGNAEVNRVLQRVDGSLRRQVNWTKRLGTLRYIGSAAACLFVGFMISHVLRPATPHDEIIPGPAIFSNTNTESVTHGPVYQVVLQDESGNVIGVQNFDKLEEAREFQNDVGQLQDKHRQIQNNIRLITDKF
jgi:hypothetical protein